MANAAQTKARINEIQELCSQLETAIADPNGGVPTDAPITFAEIASKAAMGAAASITEFGEQ